MIHEIVPVGKLLCNCSIFGDEVTREALVIDPGGDLDKILDVLTSHFLLVKAIVITHAHVDHIAAGQLLREAVGAPVYMNLGDADLLAMTEVQAAWMGMAVPEELDVDLTAREGDTLIVGGTEVRVLQTPGHTPGSISLWIPSEKKVIAGDTLFRGGIGRSDLPGGDGRQLLKSIQSKLLTLPPETAVFPGHGESTTIQFERQSNPFLKGLR